MSNDPSNGMRYSGSVYLHVLASSMLIATIGLGSMDAVRIQMRSTRLACYQAEARAFAMSAVGTCMATRFSSERTVRPAFRS